MAGAVGGHTDTQADENRDATIREFLRYVPSGDTIPEATWARRHRNIVLAVFVHVPLLMALGLYSGPEPLVTGATFPETPLWRVVAQPALVAVVAGLALVPRFTRRVRTGLASFALVLCSMTLVAFSGGFIEAHFHFFVAIVFLALYEDWLPFALGIGFVAVSHGLFGLVDPGHVYNHAAAQARPFVWGGIHAVFVLAGAVGLVTQWVSTEQSREEVAAGLAEVEAKREEIDDLERKKAEIQQARAEAESAQAKAEAAHAEAQAKQEEVEQVNEYLERKADEFSVAMARAAEGDLTVRLDAESESEAMAKIASSFNEMVTETDRTIRKIQAFARTVAAESDEVDASVTEIQRSSEDVSVSVQEIARGTDEQEEMLETVAGEMTDLSATIEEIAASADGVARTAGETASVAEAGEATAETAIENVRSVETALEGTVENIERLDTRMGEIDEIIGLIGEIAEQTNLLALNANIEAARAGGNGGGNGDGFAVVAEEVKQLAEETQRSASEIERLVTETQSQTATTVEEAQAATQSMEAGVEAVEEVTEAFASVRRNAADADAGIQEISDGTDDQATTAEEVVTKVEEVSTISGENADEAGEVSAAAEEQAATVTQVSSSVGSLSQQAERLQALLADFTVSERRTEPQAGD
jgi:methyl-accepting chemotaxis protein